MQPWQRTEGEGVARSTVCCSVGKGSAVPISFVRLRITATLTQDMADPWALFRCREPFAEAFRRSSACAGIGSCPSCAAGGDCPYPQLFSQQLSADPAGVKRHQKPPLPFAFSFPTLPATPNKSAMFTFELAVLGGAIQHLDAFVAALHALLPGRTEQEGRGIALEKIVTVGCSGEEQELAWDKLGRRLRTPPILLTLADLLAARIGGGDRLQLEWLTPAKLQHEGAVLREFAVSVFFRALLRRISSLAFHYCDGEFAVDYKWLAAQSAKIVERDDTIRWTAWGGGRDAKLSGLLGTTVLCGELEEFLPFLVAGELFHLGKGASFGLGQYRLRDCSR